MELDARISTLEGTGLEEPLEEVPDQEKIEPTGNLES